MNTTQSSRTSECTAGDGGAEDVSSLFNPVFSVELATTAAQIDEVHALRYQVYCIDRPFEDPNCFRDKRERDTYDLRSVHALIRHRTSRESVAAVRLVLSGGSEYADFPMEDPCRHRMSRTAQEALDTVPRRCVAELSRLAVSREFKRRLGEGETASGASDFVSYSDDKDGRRAMPYISLGLFAAIVRLSAKHGITHWLAVMEPTLLRLLKRYGILFEHVGPTVDYHGRRKPVFAEAAALVEGIRQRRPDVWAFITDSGRNVPPKLNHQALPALHRQERKPFKPSLVA